MSQYNILLNRFNGTSYDSLYPKNALFGSAPPTTSTVGTPGQMYVTNTGDWFTCVNTDDVNKVYTWKICNGNKPRIIVKTISGTVVTCKTQDGSKTYTQTAGSSGQIIFIVDMGTWVVSGTVVGEVISQTVTVEEIRDYNVLLYKYDPILDNNSWADIREASDENTGNNYWSIGDAKGVSINTGVNIVTNSDYSPQYVGIKGIFYAYIVAFNHNPTYEGSNRIYFCFSRATRNIEDVEPDPSIRKAPLVWEKFCIAGSTKSSIGRFSWNTCDLRDESLGQNINTTSTTCFIYYLPQELKNVLKTHTTYTGIYNNGSTYGKITSATDYIWLYAEKEVFNESRYSYTVEHDYLQQYEYFRLGNSKIMYSHTTNLINTPGNGEQAKEWWLRSPFQDIFGPYNSFLAVSDAGNRANLLVATTFSCICPIFCV